MKKTKMTEKGEVVLTDSPEEARTLQKSIPVIGICSPGSDKDWSGISFLADDWEDVDNEYAELAYCRYYHLPRVLVCGEWSVASEQKLVIGGQNFEEQTHTWLIREADKKDAKVFETLYNDDEVKRFLPYPLEKQAQTCKDWEDWIESLHQYVYPSEEPSMWVLADENDDIYVVEKGDTLAIISKKMYGDVSHVDAISRMNGLQNGNLIYIGQKLILP